MNDGLSFLISTVFSLFIMAIIIRVWMQLAQANYYSPVALAVRKITDPVVLPLRTIIPSSRRIDIAAVILAVLFTGLKIFILASMAKLDVPILPLLILSLRSLALEILQLLFWVLIIRAILSWFSQGNNPLEYVLHELTEPLLAPIRRILPAMGGLDLSVLVLIILIQFLMRLL